MPRSQKCTVCGTALRLNQCYHNQTCGEPECQAHLSLYPEATDPTRRYRNEKRRWGGARRKDRLPPHLPVMDHFELMAGDIEAALEISARTERRYQPIPSAARILPELTTDNPWGIRSKLIVALYLEADPAKGGAALRITLPPRRKIASYLHTELLKGEEYDVFLAWRCSCPHGHRVTYWKVEDAPGTTGYHDACPRCQSAPLEVIRGSEEAIDCEDL